MDSELPMTVRWRVNLQLMIIAASVLIVAATVVSTTRLTEFHLKQTYSAYKQLDAINAVRISANRYSEQIAELILIGDQERPEFESASAELEAGFGKLEKMTTDGRTPLASWTQPDERLDELHRIGRMRALYQQIGASVAEVLTLLGRDQRSDAILLFQREIENRFDAEFDNLLTAATLDEQEEVRRLEGAAGTLWRTLTLATCLAAFLAVAACVISASWLARSLVRPIHMLTQKAEAIRQRELPGSESAD